MKLFDFVISFALGGIAYMLIELIYRRRTHISMAFAGGLSFALLFGLFSKYQLQWYSACIIGAILITAIEFIVGYIVNVRMELKVWDYSTRSMNLYGQVCALFSAVWGAFSYAIFLISPAWAGVLTQINFILNQNVVQ